MGTKRAFDGELQEFIDHPKHLDYVSFPDNKTFQDGIAGRKHFRADDNPELENAITVPFILDKNFKTSMPLPLVTGLETDEIDSKPVFCPNLFSEFLEYNFPRRPLFSYDDIYSSLLNRPPRKTIPIGPDHQADVPEFNSELARNYKKNNETERFLGVCVIEIRDFNSDLDSGYLPDCECLDGGSIRCVQDHVKEARLKLMESHGREKLVDLGMVEMGEEVARRWSEEEEELFHEVVYSNCAGFGKVLWKELSVAFPGRKKKELVSYYFNVFVLRRRAVQNRWRFLEVDSDDDEWRESYGGRFGGSGVEDDGGGDFVVGGGSSEDGGGGDSDSMCSC